MRIEVGEIPLSRKSLSGVSDGFSFGEGTVGGSIATFVVTEVGGESKGRMILETESGPLEGELRAVSDTGDDGTEDPKESKAQATD